MQRNEILETVTKIINRSLLSSREIKPTDRLLEDLGLDSIGFVELGTCLEEKYQIDISDEALESLKTVEMVIEMVLTSPSYAAA